VRINMKRSPLLTGDRMRVVPMRPLRWFVA